MSTSAFPGEFFNLSARANGAMNLSEKFLSAALKHQLKESGKYLRWVSIIEWKGAELQNTEASFLSFMHECISLDPWTIIPMAMRKPLIRKCRRKVDDRNFHILYDFPLN